MEHQSEEHQTAHSSYFHHKTLDRNAVTATAAQGFHRNHQTGSLLLHRCCGHTWADLVVGYLSTLHQHNHRNHIHHHSIVLLAAITTAVVSHALDLHLVS